MEFAGAAAIRHCLDAVPFQVDRDQLLQKLRIRSEDSFSGRLLELAARAQAMARPKAVYRLCRVEPAADDAVRVEGVVLNSRVLRVHLNTLQRVFVGVSTCGAEILPLMAQAVDMLEKYWVDTLMEMALKAADQALETHIQTTYRPGPLSSICPGSLEDWPITQQAPVFEIIGAQAEAIGVTLSGSMLMQPLKSLSRLFFSGAENFRTCELCPLPHCPSRRAVYNSTLMRSKYGEPREA